MTEQNGASELLMSPSMAAQHLGIAASTLRRLAPTYEAVHGPLPWEGSDAGGGRLWPDVAVHRVHDARALVAEGRAKSLDSALRALAQGAPPPSGMLSRTEVAEAQRDEFLELLRAENAQLRDMIAKTLHEEIAGTRGELTELIQLRVAAAVQQELADQHHKLEQRPGLAERLGRRIDILLKRVRG